MKKIISVLMSVILICAIFCSCSSKPTAEMTQENITKTVDAAFTALKEVDEETLKTYVHSTTLSGLLIYTSKYKQFDDLGKAMFANLSYEIKSIDIENKTVVISVINKDLSQLSADFTQSLLSKYSTVELLKNLSNEAWLNENLTQMTAKIDAAPMQSEPAEFKVRVEPDGEHLVLYFSEKAENDVSGGALGAIMGIVSK